MATVKPMTRSEVDAKWPQFRGKMAKVVVAMVEAGDAKYEDALAFLGHRTYAKAVESNGKSA